MSRVHDALRRAEQAGSIALSGSTLAPNKAPNRPTADNNTRILLDRIQEVPFTPSPASHLMDASRPQEAPTEEFRTLRTRLTHLQGLQPIHNVVVPSPSPAEGKSFVAVNLALAEAQLADNPTLLADFDFRRPIVHNM